MHTHIVEKALFLFGLVVFMVKEADILKMFTGSEVMQIFHVYWDDCVLFFIVVDFCCT